MSYKSLLFCPDEASARLVTQVLSELEFTVDVAGETYAAVKKLTDEHFDALVVDCQNEQDAALLFKTAKNSSQNHTSLTVAVVEGQAGVAKAFRIGANLVLTKPINVEQSKGTLRVARGLLKKNQPKPAVETPMAGGSSLPAFAVSAAPVPPASANAFSASASAASFNAALSISAPEKPFQADVPYAGLELEKDSLPAAEAADAAVLDSLPQLPKASPSASVISSHAAPSVFTGLSIGGAAAAAAPALEKKSIELHAGASAPQFTNEPIVKDASAPEIFATPVAAPSFSSLESQSSAGGSKAFLKIAVVLLVIAVGGFFGWRKLQSMHRNSEAGYESTTQESQQSPSQAHQTAAQAQAPSPAVVIPAPIVSDPGSKNSEEEISVNTSAPKTQHSVDTDNIEIQEMPFSRDSKVTVTPKPQPLVVKAATPKPAPQDSIRAPAPVAPSLDIAANASTATIANLMPADAPLPKAAPGTVRISQGVSQGLLMKKVAPAYPTMALQLHREGVVELLATVSREGRIANVKVLSGDSMLVKSAVDAVRQWQYRPYLLNGQPLEVETQISVSFKLPK